MYYKSRKWTTGSERESERRKADKMKNLKCKNQSVCVNTGKTVLKFDNKKKAQSNLQRVLTLFCDFTRPSRSNRTVESCSLSLSVRHLLIKRKFRVTLERKRERERTIIRWLLDFCFVCELFKHKTFASKTFRDHSHTHRMS